MKYLFVHQNFPAQFRRLAATLAAEPGNEVCAIGSGTAVALPGVRLLRYELGRPANPAHPFARFFDNDCRHAEQVLYSCMQLVAEGFRPDVIVVHSGWGEALPLRTAFPAARLVLYAELFYRTEGLDVGFDPEFGEMSTDRLVGLRVRNASTLLGLAECDVAITPTRWQQASFPIEFREKIEVVHEGVDIEVVRPDPSAQLRLPDGTVLRPGDPVVTYVSRDLEPVRGYHSFMRALPEILAGHGEIRVVIIGGDGTSYGGSAPAGTTWKALFRDEIAGRTDLSRVHYLGRVSYEDYLSALRVSAAHVYLTYPFVLSWSMLEAMAAGCALVASATPPVEEVVDGTNGILVDFFRPGRIAGAVLEALAGGPRVEAMRARARQTILRDYDSRSCTATVRRLFEPDHRARGAV